MPINKGFIHARSCAHINIHILTSLIALYYKLQVLITVLKVMTAIRMPLVTTWTRNTLVSVTMALQATAKLVKVCHREANLRWNVIYAKRLTDVTYISCISYEILLENVCITYKTCYG